MTDMIAIDRSLAQEEFARFAVLSGDDNAIHVDADFAARTRFGRPVAHGVLLLTVLRGLAERLAPGLRQVSQQAMFPAPTFAGDLMTFTARVTSRNGGETHIAMSAIRRADEVITCEALGVFRP